MANTSNAIASGMQRVSVVRSESDGDLLVQIEDAAGGVKLLSFDLDGDAVRATEWELVEVLGDVAEDDADAYWSLVLPAIERLAENDLTLSEVWDAMIAAGATVYESLDFDDYDDDENFDTRSDGGLFIRLGGESILWVDERDGYSIQDKLIVESSWKWRVKQD